MKTVMRLALCGLLLVGCGKSASSQMDDMKAQIDDLTHRIKTLEDDRLKLEKQVIQEQQALQAMHERVRNIENYFDKMQVGQTAVPR